MKIDDDVSTLMEKIPSTDECCFCIPLKTGTKIIAILGIVLGFSCAAMLMLKDRKYLTTSTIILISLLSIFIITTIMFVVVSVILLVAAFDENPDLMYYYIWLAGAYLFVQLLLAIVIPIVLVIDGLYSIAFGLMWTVVVMIVALGWAHFIDSKYKTFKDKIVSTSCESGYWLDRFKIYYENQSTNIKINSSLVE